jgi:hypothetical protein
MFLSFEYGNSSLNITDMQQARAICPHCRQQSVMVFVYQNIHHVSDYPQYTRGQDWNMFCTNCRELDTSKSMSPELAEYVQGEMKKAKKHSLFLKICAAGFWLSIAAVVGLFISIFI